MEEWVRNATWGFYEHILLNYDVLIVGNHLVVWRRKPGEWRSPDPTSGRIRVMPDGPGWFKVPAPPGSAPDAPRVVEVEYEVTNPLGGVPVCVNLEAVK